MIKPAKELQEQFIEEAKFLTEHQIKSIESTLDPYASINDKFQLATVYITQTRDENRIKKGIEFMKEILLSKEKTIDDFYKRDCLYYIARGNYELRDYVEARRWLDTLMRRFPNNQQGEKLSELLDEKIKYEGMKGLAIGGGIATVLAGGALVGGILLFSLLRKSK